MSCIRISRRSIVATAVAAAAGLTRTANAGTYPLPEPILKMLDQRGGAAVVLDASTGSVVATHGGEIANEQLRAPGSAFKPIIAQALLAYSQSAERRCARVLMLAGRRFDCTHPVVPYPLDLKMALAFSCNSYFVSLHLPYEAVQHAAQRAGWFAARRGSRPGSMTPPRTLVEERLQALGEFGVSCTPLGLAEVYRRLSQIAEAEVREGLRLCVTNGTGQLAAIAGLAVAGKTGTAPTPGTRILQGWFAGWTPYESPKWVVAIWIAQGKGGPDAAPIAARIFEWLKSREGE